MDWIGHSSANGVYPPGGVSYGLDTPPLMGGPHRAEYPTVWQPAANGSITTGRILLRLEIWGYPPEGLSYGMHIHRYWRDNPWGGGYRTDWIYTANRRIPAERSILWIGYPRLIGGYPPGGVSYGLEGYPPGGVSYGLAIDR